MRTALRVLSCTFVLLAISGALAHAEFRGTDILSNISPQSQLNGGLIDKYPLSAFSLDYHVEGPEVTDTDLGPIDVPTGISTGDIPSLILQVLASIIWAITSFFVHLTIVLFSWAFSLDLLNGQNGAMAPIGRAIKNLYSGSLGTEWFIAGITALGIWATWKMIGQRKMAEGFAGIGKSLVFVLIAMFFVFQPQQTIGQFSAWANSLSLSFLSGTQTGELGDLQTAKQKVADHLFTIGIYQPWQVLEFGGLKHCVDTGRPDADGFPRPVGPFDPTKDVCRDHDPYAKVYLADQPGTDARDEDYTNLKDGKAPFDKIDSPAADAQQAGGALQRLMVAVFVAVCASGMIVLLLWLSLAIIIAQVLALMLVAFAPVALIVALFPGKGHAFFAGWGQKLGVALFIKALLSLVLAVLVAVSMALLAATSALGFLFAFSLQSAFFWAVILKRKWMTEPIMSHRETMKIEKRSSETVRQAAGVAAAVATPIAAVRGRIRPKDTPSPDETPHPDTASDKEAAPKKAVGEIPLPVEGEVEQHVNGSATNGPSRGVVVGVGGRDETDAHEHSSFNQSYENGHRRGEMPQPYSTDLESERQRRREQSQAAGGRTAAPQAPPVRTPARNTPVRTPSEQTLQEHVPSPPAPPPPAPSEVAPFQDDLAAARADWGEDPPPIERPEIVRKPESQPDSPSNG